MRRATMTCASTPPARARGELSAEGEFSSRLAGRERSDGFSAEYSGELLATGGRLTSLLILARCRRPGTCPETPMRRARILDAVMSGAHRRSIDPPPPTRRARTTRARRPLFIGDLGPRVLPADLRVAAIAAPRPLHSPPAAAEAAAFRPCMNADRIAPGPVSLSVALRRWPARADSLAAAALAAGGRGALGRRRRRALGFATATAAHLPRRHRVTRRLAARAAAARQPSQPPELSFATVAGASGFAIVLRFTSASRGPTASAVRLRRVAVGADGPRVRHSPGAEGVRYRPPASVPSASPFALHTRGLAASIAAAGPRVEQCTASARPPQLARRCLVRPWMLARGRCPTPRRRSGFSSTPPLPRGAAPYRAVRRWARPRRRAETMPGADAPATGAAARRGGVAARHRRPVQARRCAPCWASRCGRGGGDAPRRSSERFAAAAHPTPWPEVPALRPEAARPRADRTASPPSLIRAAVAILALAGAWSRSRRRRAGGDPDAA